MPPPRSSLPLKAAKPRAAATRPPTPAKPPPKTSSPSNITNDPLEVLTLLITTDEEFRAVLERVERLSANFRRNEILAEVREVHSSRTLQNLQGTRVSSKAVQGAITAEVRARHRLSELYEFHLTQLSVVEDLMEAMQAHLSAHYSDELNAFGTTETRRKAVMNTFLKPAIKYQTNLRIVKDSINAILTDIDKCGYHLTSLRELVVRLEGPALGGH